MSARRQMHVLELPLRLVQRMPKSSLAHVSPISELRSLSFFPPWSTKKDVLTSSEFGGGGRVRMGA
eukprot:scaffold2848_cov352-Pavlova_lutheri.AAC.65